MSLLEVESMHALYLLSRKCQRHERHQRVHRVLSEVLPKQPSMWKPAHLLLQCSHNQDGSCWSLIWHIIQGIHLEQA